MSSVENALHALDAPSVGRVQPVLAWLRSHGDPDAESPVVLRRFLTEELPRRRTGDVRERHEVAWALGDLFEAAGLVELARLCRSGPVHDTLAVWQWVRSFGDVTHEFWRPALTAVTRPAAVPRRASLSLSGARAVLQAVGDGLSVGPEGELPPATVAALDDRFRWTEEFPWMDAGRERDLPPLRFLREHLVAQGLLVREGRRLVRSVEGDACVRETSRLWGRVVDPAPRWTREFERDALGVLAASVLRSSDFTLGRVGEELTHVLAAKWRPAQQDSVFDGAAAVAQSWYQLGVPLGWWDTGRGPADRIPNVFGRAAAVAVFRAVARPGAGPVAGPVVRA